MIGSFPHALNITLPRSCHSASCTLKFTLSSIQIVWFIPTCCKFLSLHITAVNVRVQGVICVVKMDSSHQDYFDYSAQFLNLSECSDNLFSAFDDLKGPGDGVVASVNVANTEEHCDTANGLEKGVKQDASSLGKYMRQTESITCGQNLPPHQNPLIQPSRLLPSLSTSASVVEITSSSQAPSSSHAVTGSKAKSRSRRLGAEAKAKLTEWFDMHVEWPYPSEQDEKSLLEATGLSLRQIRTFFSNRRTRSRGNTSEYV